MVNIQQVAVFYGEQLQERARAHDLGKLRNELQRDLAQSFFNVLGLPVFLHWGNNTSDGLPVMDSHGTHLKKPGTAATLLFWSFFRSQVIREHSQTISPKQFGRSFESQYESKLRYWWTSSWYHFLVFFFGSII